MPFESGLLNWAPLLEVFDILRPFVRGRFYCPINLAIMQGRKRGGSCLRRLVQSNGGRMARAGKKSVRAARRKKPVKAASAAIPKSKRDAGTEDSFLTATAELLTHRGNLDFSLAEVAARTGRSAALVQYYFGSKLGLLSALLQRTSIRDANQMNGLLAMDISAKDKFRFHVRALVRTYVKAPYIDRLLHHVINDSDDLEAQRISEFYVTRVVEFYRRLIAQGVSEGSMRPLDPMHLYFILIGTGDHLAARRRLLAPALGVSGMDTKFVSEFGDALFHTLWSGLEKPQ